MTMGEISLQETGIASDQILAPAKLSAYAELYCISNFTFLRGASFPEELVEHAHSLGYSALAITDECSLSGVVRAHMAAKEREIALIIGSEFHLEEGCHLVLLACNRRGYGNLSHLISCARRESDKGSYRINYAMVEKYLPTDCIALWLPDLKQAPEKLAYQALWLQRIFTNHLWIAVELLLRGDDRMRLQQLERFSMQK